MVQTALCTQGSRDVLLDGRSVDEGAIHCHVGEGNPEHELRSLLGLVVHGHSVVTSVDQISTSTRELGVRGALDEVEQGKEEHCGHVAERRLEEVARHSKEDGRQDSRGLAEGRREVRGQPGAKTEDAGEHKGESAEHHGVGGEGNLHRGHFKCVVFFCIGQNTNQ